MLVRVSITNVYQVGIDNLRNNIDANCGNCIEKIEEVARDEFHDSLDESWGSINVEKDSKH